MRPLFTGSTVYAREQSFYVEVYLYNCLRVDRENGLAWVADNQVTTVCDVLNQSCSAYELRWTRQQLQHRETRDVTQAVLTSAMRLSQSPWSFCSSSHLSRSHSTLTWSPAISWSLPPSLSPPVHNVHGTENYYTNAVA